MLNAMPQLVTRIDPDLAAAVDRLVRDGVVASRSEAVRLGLEQLVEGVRRASVGEAIVEGYRRQPQHSDEMARAELAVRALVSEEPW
jgi:Arc/MetJ-type ribon-helix-helix transcriptional regulator